VSLGNVCRWLGTQAEAAGVEIYPGFAAAEVLYTDDGKVKGVATGDMGIGKHGEKTARYAPGMELHAKYTVFAEGCRGSLGKTLEARFKLREGVAPQVYGIGVKELWEVKAEKHVPGLVLHGAGWPLASDTYGGSWLYHAEGNQVSVGLRRGAGLQQPLSLPVRGNAAVQDPSGDPRLLRGRAAPLLRRTRDLGGRRAVAAEDDLSGRSPGGRRRGLLNAARIKGSHAAIKSGMLAAEAAFEALAAGRAGDELTAFPQAFKSSWLHDELHRAPQLQAAHVGQPLPGALMVGIDQVVFRGKAPWTLTHARADHESSSRRRAPPDRVSEARRRPHVRPPLLGVRLEHQSRGRPAAAPQAREPRVPSRSTSRFTTGPRRATVLLGCTNS
jgi:electron-transferring-flavoprotein dehydrogenase